MVDSIELAKEGVQRAQYLEDGADIGVLLPQKQVATRDYQSFGGSLLVAGP
jgi:hypothetical protein